MSENAAELKELITKIFDDNIVETKEREALQVAKESLDSETVHDVFKEFFKEKWGEAVADDLITGVERSLLGKIYLELGLELNDLPPMARIALKDQL